MIIMITNEKQNCQTFEHLFSKHRHRKTFGDTKRALSPFVSGVQALCALLIDLNETVCKESKLENNFNEFNKQKVSSALQDAFLEQTLSVGLGSAVINRRLLYPNAKIIITG